MNQPNTYWNRENEFKIYKLLLDHEKLHFNKILALFYPDIKSRKNPNVLSRYLKKMNLQKWIEIEFERPNYEDDDSNRQYIGKRTFYSLSDSAKEFLDFGVYDLVKTNRDQKKNTDFSELTEPEKKKIINLLLISLIGQGSHINRKEHGAYTFEDLGGFRVSDLLVEKRLSEYFGHFHYLKISKNQIIEYLNKLKKHKPPIIQVLEKKYENEKLYDISDDLIQFVIVWTEMLLYLSLRMERIWKYRNKTREEKLWYYNIYGKDNSDKLFRKIQYINEDAEREKLRKRYREKIKHAKISETDKIKLEEYFINFHIIDYIREYDDSLEKNIKWLKSQISIKEKYRGMYKIMMDLLDQSFLQKSFNEYKRKQEEVKKLLKDIQSLNN